MSTKGIAYHKNTSGNKTYGVSTRGLNISSNAFEEIDLQAKKYNLTKIKMVDAMVKFFVNNYVIVEQLSLSSNGRII